MEDIFITQIQIKELLHLHDVIIPLDENERKHLILTGKNGSGKTTLLNNLRLYFLGVFGNNLFFDVEVEIDYNIDLNELEYEEKENIIIAFFPAKRKNQLRTPKGIEKILVPEYLENEIDEYIGKEFIQYLVNLKADRSFARDDNDLETVKNIDTWFENFEKSLFSLFDSPNIELKFDRETYNFLVIEEGKPAYNFTQLSDGYSAILTILSELIMRMQAQNPSSSLKNYDIQGVVLIDEIETHLHIDLQKKILPFFTSFFPKIQFIVTTHSPFVISSIEDAVIFDLEKNIIARDLSGYSYDTIIESYFESDKYSNFLKAKIVEYENLIEKDALSDLEVEKLEEIKKYLKEIPKFVSDELAVKIQQLRLKELDKKHRI